MPSRVLGISDEEADAEVGTFGAHCFPPCKSYLHPARTFFADHFIFVSSFPVKIILRLAIRLCKKYEISQKIDFSYCFFYPDMVY